MERENLKIVFVGHIDHGKSSLIGRLLYDTKSLPQEKIEDMKYDAKKLGKELEFAFIMDHLKEEREKGITIDTAQTFFKTDKRDYVIIDAPGHKEFIKNMITGASQAEAAILIVDANEGVQDQSKRHAYILNLLGIDQIIVAINKMDTVEYNEERFNQVKTNIIEFLKSIDVNADYVIPISASKGDNIVNLSEKMPWYNDITIVKALDNFKPMTRMINQPLRLPVQDVYEFDGEKIVVGRIESGKIKSGETISVLPSKNKIKINSIKSGFNTVEEAEVGESIGITLDADGIKRGDIISDENRIPKNVDSIDAKLLWLSPKTVKVGENLLFRCTTQEVNCKIEKIYKSIDCSSLKIIQEDAQELNEHEIGEIKLKLDSEVFIDDFNELREFGRFVIERENNIAGGGIITE